jgi:O-antigen ligase
MGNKTIYLLMFGALCLNILGLFYTPNIEYGLQYAMLNVHVIGVMWVVSRELATKKRATIILWVVTLAGILVSVETFLGAHAARSLFFGELGASYEGVGSIGNSNYTGAYLLFPLFASLTLICEGPCWKRTLAGAAHIVILVALYSTKARASYLGAAVGYFVFGWLIVRDRPKLALYTAIGSVMVVGLCLASPKEARHRLCDATTIVERVKYWQAATYLWLQAPIQGLGIGAFRSTVYQAQRDLGQRDARYWEGYQLPKPRRAHNEYLEVLVEGGFLAATVLGMLAFLILTGSYRTAKQFPWVGCYAGIIAIMVTALFFFPFRVPASAVMSGVYLGLLAGACKESK